MADNVDTRIMQLQFENREFEKNIAKSTKSIEDLKEAMDFEETSSGLEQLASAFQKLDIIGSISDNLQKLTDKFTGLGDVGEYILSRIRYSIESVAQSMQNLIRSISTAQISVGQGKYDALNKSVQTIIAGGKYTEEEAYKTMERVMTYTSQTSHNFQTMVGQIASLQSIGMDLTEAELLIEGIGNASTMAGGGAGEAATAMSVLSKAIGANYLSYQQFLTLSQTARVVTDDWRKQLVEAAVAAGDLEQKNGKIFTAKKYGKQMEVTSKNLESTLSKKWASANTLKKMYQNYQFAADDINLLAHPDLADDSLAKTAYLTGQRALTLADAWNAVKESVSSGWMESFRLIFGDVTEAAQHFTNVCDRIIESLEGIGEFRNNLLKAFSFNNGRTSLLQLLLGSYEDDAESGAVGLLDTLDRVGKLIYDGFVDFMSIFAAGDEKKLMKEDPEYFSAWLGTKARDAVNGIQTFMQGLQSFFDTPVQINGKLTTRMEVIHDIVDGIVSAMAFGYFALNGVKEFILEIASQLGPSFDYVISLFGDIGSALYNAAQGEGKAQKLVTFFRDLAKALSPITTGINMVVRSVANFVRAILGLNKEGSESETVFSRIGDLFKVIADILSKVGGPILTFFSKFVDAVTSLVTNGISKETLQQFGRDLGTAFNSMIKSFTENLPEGMKFFGDWIRDLFGLWEEGSEDRSGTFFSFIRRLFSTGFSSLDEFLSSLLGGYDLKTAMQNGFGFGAAYNFLHEVMGWFKGTNLYSVLMAFLGAASLGSLVTLIFQIKKAVKTIGGFFDDVGGNLKAGITGRYEWFSEKLVNFAKSIGILVACVVVLGSMNPAALAQGIIALGLVMLALVGLFKMINSQSQTLMTQAAITGMIDSIVISIAALCVALSVLSLAILPLASDTGKTINALILIAGMLTIFGVFIKIMMETMDKFTFGLGKTNQWAGVGKMALMLLALSVTVAILSASIGALAIAIAPLAAIGWSGMLSSIVAIGLMLTMFGTFIMVMLNALDEFAFRIGGEKNGLAGIGKTALMLLVLSGTMILLSASMATLILAISPLAAMGWKGMLTAVSGLGLILTELTIFMKQLQGMNASDKTASLKIAGFAAFAASLGLLIASLIPLSMMNFWSMMQAILGLGLVLAEIIGFMKLAQTMKVTGIALGGFSAFSASVGILMLSIIPLAHMDFWSMMQAVFGLGLVLAEIIGFMKLAMVANVTGIALGGFIGFALSIAILLFALKPLSEMTPEGYLQGIVGLATVMLEIVLLMGVMKLVQPDLKSSLSVMGLLIALGASMILFGIAFNEVKDVPWQNMVAFAGGLAIILTAIAFASAICEQISIKGVLILAIGLAAIMGVIALMAPLVIGSISGGLRSAAGDLAIVAGLLQSFGGKMGSVDEGGFDKAARIFDKVTILVTKMAGMMFASGFAKTYMQTMSMLTLAMDEIVKFNQRSNTLDQDGGVNKAIKIVDQMKGLFRDHLSGFGEYGTSAQAFYDAVYKLGSGFDYFDSMTKNAGDPEDNNGLKMIQQLAACASDLDIIYKMDLDKFQRQLAGLGGAMILYAKGAENVSSNGNDISEDTDIGGAITLLRKISESFSKEGGFDIPDNMPDSTEITDFGIQLAALAGALVAFEEAGSDIGEGTEKALSTLDFFEELKTRLALYSSFGTDLSSAVNVFKNENGDSINKDELTTFGEDIAQLGSSMAHFASSTQVVDAETGEIKPIDFSKATDALTAIVDLQNKLPSVGGVITYITGTKQDLSDLATELNLLGDSLSEFHTSTTTYDEANKTATPMDFTNTITFLTSISDIQSKLPKVKGFDVQSLFESSDMSLGTFGSEIAQLGIGLNEFASAINGDGTEGSGVGDAFKEENVTPVMTTIDSMISFMQGISEKLPRVGGLGEIMKTIFNGRGATLKDVGDAIGSMGEGMATFGSKIKGKFASADDTNNAIALVDSFVSIMTKLAMVNTELMYGDFGVYARGLGEFLEGLTKPLDLAVEDRTPAIDSIIQLISYVNTAMKDIGEIDAGNIDIFNTLTQALANLASINLVDSTVDFENVGMSIATGVATGITNGTSIVTAAATAMAIAAYNAAMTALDAASPSKLFIGVGGFIGAGMAIGIDNSAQGVADSATALSESAIDSAGNMMATIGRIMAEETNASPTISPVLDMTNIRNGMASFDRSLYGRTIGIDTSYSAGFAGRMVGNVPTGYEETNQNRISLDGIYERMNTMTMQIASLGTSISNMKLVLDSGVVAGGVTDGVDQNIGRKAFYAGRRN